jgi:Zn-dependent membrane protease YugP
MALILIIVGLAVLLVVLPQVWIHRVMDRHAVERHDIPLTGGEAARDMLDRLNLAHVKVEPTELGNHYDPESRTVRLEPRLHNGHSLAALTVAAHEVGHAMQHAMELPMFQRRIAIAKRAHIFSVIASGFLFAAPLLMLIGKTPMALIINLVGWVGTLLLSIITQVMTLPVEFDASFKRALPLLQRSGYVRDKDLPAARDLLKAAAYTYVAGLLRTLVTIPGIGRLPRL